MGGGAGAGGRRGAALVGRAQTRRELTRFIERAGAGARVACLTGEAGIGKTRLAVRCAEHAEGLGMRVMTGHANPIDAMLPLGVMRDAMRHWIRAGADVAATGDPLVDAFPSWLLPELGGGAPEDVALDVLFEGAVRYLRAAAGGRGLLLILEDMHHSAATSCALVRHLARAAGDAPVAILVTLRTEELTPHLVELRHSLVRDRLGEEHALAPLPRDDAARMVEDLLGATPSDAAMDAVMRASGGNPFAVEEVVRDALDRGVLRPGDGTWRAGGPVALPWTVREMVLARARRLDPADRELLRTAAVVGEEVDVWLLAAAGGIPQDVALAAVARMRDAGLVVDAADGSARVSFRHALTRDAVLEDMLGAERAARHRRVLDALEERHGDSPDPPVEMLLAHSLGAGERERGVRYSVDAGRRSRHIGAHDEAARHFERALGMWTPELGQRVRAEVLLDHGRVLAAVGDRHAAIAALQEARRAAIAVDAPGIAAVALAIAADARLELHEREAAVADLERAVAELDRRPGQPAERLEVLALLARAQLVCGSPQVAVDVARRALPLADPGRSTWVNLSITLGAGLAGLGHVEEGVARLREATRTAREMGDDVTAIRGLLKLAGTHREVLADAAADTDEAVALARARGWPRLLVRALWHRALLHVDAGEWDAVDACAEEAERLLGEAGSDPVAQMGLAVVRGMRARRVGRMAEAMELYGAVAEEATRLGIEEREREARVGLARTRLSAGDPQSAWEAIEPAIERWGGLEGGTASPAVALLVTGAEILAVLGDAGETRALAARVVRRSPGPRGRYATALADAAAGRRPEPGAIDGAAAEVAATGRLPEATRMRMCGAEILVRVPGAETEAGDLAQRAHADYRAMGSEEWGRRAEGLLRRLGRRVPGRPGSAGPDGLTPREREVLALIAEGLSNRGIADRLVISEATAARHVFNIFTKLGVHSRAQAVAVHLGGA